MHTPLDQVAIGQRIREVRGAATQAQFAAKLGVGRVSVARYETGERTPDAEFIARICVTFGVEALWLLLGREVVGTEAAPLVAQEPASQSAPLSPHEAEHLELYRRAGEHGQQGLIDSVTQYAVKNPAQKTFDPEATRASVHAADPRPVEAPESFGPRGRRIAAAAAKAKQGNQK